MGEIIESIINGQRRQALEQLRESSFTLEDLFVELRQIAMTEEIIRMYRVAVSTGYIKISS